MERSDFLAALNREARGLQSHLAPDSRRWFVNLIAMGLDSGQSDRGLPRSVPIDRIYELLCYFSIAGPLCQKASEWRLLRGNGRHGYRLPYSPGLKENFAFLRFRFGQEVYDLCCGIELPVANEPGEAPDITLQRTKAFDGDDRAVGDVVGLWEGKYHSEDYKMSRADVAQMLSRCEVLKLPRCRVGDVLDRLVPEPFKVNAIVSNSPHATFNREQRLRWSFSIVFNFDGSAIPQVEPTRAEHWAYVP